MNTQLLTETDPPADQDGVLQDVCGAEWDELIEEVFEAFDPQTIGYLMQTPAFVSGLQRALRAPAT